MINRIIGALLLLICGIALGMVCEGMRDVGVSLIFGV